MPRVNETLRGPDEALPFMKITSSVAQIWFVSSYPQRRDLRRTRIVKEGPVDDNH